MAQVDVKRTLNARRQTCLKANLGGAQIPSFASAAHHFFDRKEVSLFGPVAAAERAKSAALHTYVGEIDVSIDNVCDLIANRLVPHLVGCRDQHIEKLPFRTEQEFRVGGA